MGCGPVCVPARRTRLQLLSCDMWLSEGVGEEVLVPSGMLNHGGQHVAGASRGSCVQRGIERQGPTSQCYCPVGSDGRPFIFLCQEWCLHGAHLLQNCFYSFNLLLIIHTLCAWPVLAYAGCLLSPQRTELIGLDLSLQEGLWTPDEASPVRITGISVCILASVCPQGWTHPGGLFVHCLDEAGLHLHNWRAEAGLCRILLS